MTHNRSRLVALLPIKAHSERVPQKNFKKFAGKPLFHWVLSTLLSIDEIECIVINTDARKLLLDNGISATERILIRDRPDHLCGDLVSMNSVLADDVTHVEADTYLMTHTTNPLLTRKTILNAIATYRDAVTNGTADSLFSVNRFQTRFYRADASPVNHDPDNLCRTQDLEPWFEENSNLYLFSKASFQKTSARIGAKPLLFETPQRESIDIDDTDSWNLAESLATSTIPSG